MPEQPQANASSAGPAVPAKVKHKYKELEEELNKTRSPLVNEYNSIILPPIIWNTIANLEIFILNKSFLTLLEEVLTKQFLKITDKIKRKALKELRQDAAAYIKSEPDVKAKKLQDIENCFIKNLINLPLPPEWGMNLSGPGWKENAQSKAEQLIFDGIANLKRWRAKPEIEKVHQLTQKMTPITFRSRISTSSTRLQNVGTHPSLIIMLANINLFEPFLKVILEKYEAIDGKGGMVQISDINEKLQQDLDTPLHCAVRDLNESFTKWLLEQEHIDPNRLNKRQETPLEQICKKYDLAKKQTQKMDLTTQQLDEIKIELEEYRKFIRMLLDKGACFEVPSKILQCFALVSKHNDREGLVKEGLVLMQKEEDEFLQECFQKVKPINDFDLMASFLRLRDQKKFMEKLLSLSVEHTERFVEKLIIKIWLNTAVFLNLRDSVGLIIKQFGSKIFLVSNQEPKSDAAVNRTKPIYLKHRAELKGLLRKACDNANPAILKLLLTRMNGDELLINFEPILIQTLQYCVKLVDNSQRKSDLMQCARLMAGDKRISMAKTDPEGNTALHIALKYGLDDIAMTICTKHPFAFLGIGNKKDETPLDYATHAFLEEYLDKTVHTIKGHNKEFKLDYNGFCSYYSKKMQQRSELVAKNPKNNNKTLSVIDCIKQISNSSKLKPLLNHPVIKTYVQIQWLHWSILHVFNLLFTLFMAGCFIVYTIEYFCHGNFSIALYVMNWFGCLAFVIRELFQWAVFGTHYFRQHENVFDIVNIALMCIILSLNSKDVGFWILLAALNVILFAYEIICLAGALSVDIFASYRWMLLVVAKNFFLSIFAFCPILLAFYYSFYLVYNRLSTSKSSDTSANNTSDNTFNTFRTGLDGGVKILVMTIGELEAATMEIDLIKVFIFIPFILIVPMIIQNLINGLAVSDISEIRGESELINLRNKVHLLARIESGLDRGYLRNNIPKIISLLKYLPQQNYSKFFFQKYSHVVKITVDKNDCAKIMVQRRNPKQSDSSKNANTGESKRGEQAAEIASANQTMSSDSEPRNTNGEGSHLVPSPNENQATTITMPNSENTPPNPSTIAKQDPSQESLPSDIETRNTNGEGSHLLPSRNENQATTIAIPNAENATPIPSTIAKQNSSTEPMPSDIEAFNTNGEGSLLLPSRNENQATTIAIPNTENATPIPSSIAKQNSSTEPMPSDIETRNTNGEGSHLLPSRNENQVTTIAIPNTENATPIPSTIAKPNPSQDNWLYVLRIPMPKRLRETFKILPLEATIDKTVLRNLQRIADQTKVIK